jgi:hypothetical protein
MAPASRKKSCQAAEEFQTSTILEQIFIPVICAHVQVVDDPRPRFLSIYIQIYTNEVFFTPVGSSIMDLLYLAIALLVY